MSRIKLAIAATAALLVTASMAQASPFEFRGFYAGGHFGYLDVDADFGGGGGNLSDDGLMGGLQAGYNYVSGNFMWGIETDLSLANASPSGTCAYNTTLSCDIDVGPIATLRPRIGYAVDDWLLYVTGGIAAAHFDVDSETGAGVQVDDADGGSFGWTLGAGVEYLIGDIVGVKLEYRYMRFGDFDFDPFTCGGCNADIDFDMHAIMAGVNFHF